MSIHCLPYYISSQKFRYEKDDIHTLQDKLKLYHNPSANSFTIEFLENDGVYILKIKTKNQWHTKINYVLILFLATMLFAGCKKKSKEFTTVIWEVVNPVTDEPYANMLVRLYEAKKKNSGIEHTVLFEGKTNHMGIAEFSFKANLTSGYWYKPEINEGSLGVNGIDYSVIKQPSPSDESVKKDEENIIRYEIVPYGEFIIHIKNVDCQNASDKMRYRVNQIYTRPYDGFSNWSPSPTLTSGNYEGCYESSSNVLVNPSDSIIYELEVTKNNSIELIKLKFHNRPNVVDTMKLYY